MQKLQALGFATFLALSLTSCALGQDRTGPQMSVETNPEKHIIWKHYSSTELGVSFDYPSNYIPDSLRNEPIAFNDDKISLQEVFLYAGEGEAPIIVIMKSADPRFLEYLSWEQSFELEKVVVNGKKIHKIVWDGMGTPVGYLLTEKSPYVVVEFVFPPDEETIERVVQSIEIVQN